MGKSQVFIPDSTKSKTDDVTSRILWFDGLEKGLNKGEELIPSSATFTFMVLQKKRRLGKPRITWLHKNEK